MSKKKDNIVNLESKRPLCKCKDCNTSNKTEDLYVHSGCCNADLDILVTESGRIKYKCQNCGKESAKNIFSFLMRDNIVYSTIGYSKELYKLLDDVLKDIGCELTDFVDFCMFTQIKEYINGDEESKQSLRDFVKLCIEESDRGDFYSWLFEEEEEEV